MGRCRTASQPAAVNYLLCDPLQVIPSGQSLIADFYTDSNRGKAFGGLFLTGAVGGMLGSLYATNLGKWPLYLASLYRLCSAIL
jgi:MFS family permease